MVVLRWEIDGSQARHLPPVLGAKKKMGLGQTLTASLLFSLPETEGRLVPG